jgi:hypothetical protein
MSPERERGECAAPRSALAPAQKVSKSQEWWCKRRTLIGIYGKYGILLSASGLCGLFLFGRVARIKRTADTPASNFVLYEFSLIICLVFFLWALSGWRVGVLQFKPFSTYGELAITLSHSSDHADEDLWSKI